MNKILYIIRGTPGSGKTTLASSLGCPSVSADDFMVDGDGNYHWTREMLPVAHRLCQRNVANLMATGNERISVANTFTREWEIDPYVALAEKYGYTVHRLIIENTHGNGSIHDVPQETMERMKTRFSIKL